MKMKSRLGGLVLAVITVNVLLLGSCSTPSTTPSGTSTTGTKPYGSLTIEARFGSTSLDPPLSEGSTYTGMTSAIFDQLVDPTPAGEPIPGLAERWEISPDGKSHTFYIRKGVKFHDGSDLTGEDVKFSMDRMLAPEATNANAAVWRGVIDRIELKDNYTVVMRMKTPQFDLLKGISDFGGTAAVVPKKYIEQKGVDYFRRNPVGSGPFRFVKHEPGIRLEFEAVEDHWRAVPKFKNITLLYLPEEATRIAMLKTGELDIGVVSPEAAGQLKTAGLGVLKWDGTNQAFMQLYYDLENPQKYAFGDVRVRKALSLGIDRKELVDRLYAGFAEPSALIYLSTKSSFFDANVLKPDPYEPEGAKKLLAEAGYSSGFAVRQWDVGGGGMVSTLSQALSGYWRRIGVNTELVRADRGTFSVNFMPKHDPILWPSIHVALTGGGVIGLARMPYAYHSTKSYWKTIKNPELDALFDKLLVTLDPAEKKRIVLQAAVMAKNEYNSIGVLNLLEVAGVSPKVGGLTTITGFVDFGFVLDRITHAK